MLIWAVTLPVAAHTWGQAALGGHLGLGEGAARRLWALRWWLTAAAYLAVVLTVVVGLWDSWMLVL